MAKENSQRLAQKIKQIISNTKLEKAFEYLDACLKTEGEVYDDFVLLKNRFNKNKKEFLGEIIDYNIYTNQDNKITVSLLHFLNTLNDNDLKEEASHIEHKNEITNPILVICENETAQKQMQGFFEVLHFTKVDVKVLQAFQAAANYDLIIFDNRGLIGEKDETKIDKRIQLMEAYSSKSDLFFIHLGGYLPWLNDKRERFHAANSKFALFARVQEMIAFINRYKT